MLNKLAIEVPIEIMGNKFHSLLILSKIKIFKALSIDSEI